MYESLTNWLSSTLTDPRSKGYSSARYALVGLVTGFVVALIWCLGLTTFVAITAPEHLDKLAWLPSLLWGSGTGAAVGMGAYAANQLWSSHSNGDVTVTQAAAAGMPEIVTELEFQQTVTTEENDNA